jgi:hypothetical protein
MELTYGGTSYLLQDLNYSRIRNSADWEDDKWMKICKCFGRKQAWLNLCTVYKARKTTGNLCQSSLWPGRDFNWTSPEHESAALPISQTVLSYMSEEFLNSRTTENRAQYKTDHRMHWRRVTEDIDSKLPRWFWITAIAIKRMLYA